MTCRTRTIRRMRRIRPILRTSSAALLAALLLLAATPAVAVPGAPVSADSAIGASPITLSALVDAFRSALASFWLPASGGASPGGESGGAMDPDGGPQGESGGTMDPDGRPLGG